MTPDEIAALVDAIRAANPDAKGVVVGVENAAGRVEVRWNGMTAGAMALAGAIITKGALDES